MIKFYTPSNWSVIFDAPSIIIDDDGYIYTEDEYYKLSRAACGRVDTQTGYVYGKGHYSGLTAPIGQFRQGHNCVEIYGDNYASPLAAPIYYMKGDAVYPAEEYGKIFGAPTGYIKGDIGEGFGNEEGNYVPAGSNRASKREAGGVLSFVWTCIKTVALIIGLLALSGWLWYEMYFSEYPHTREFVANVICLIIGFIAAIFKKDEKTLSFTVIFWVSTILFGLFVGVGILFESGFGFKSVLFSILGMLMAALYCLTPSLLLSVVLGFVKIIIDEIRRGKRKKEGNK